MTTVLDTVGLLGVAAGVAAGAYPYVGGWSVAVAGGLVMGVSAWWGRSRGERS